MEQIVNIIGTVGFPIAACLGLGWFIYQMVKKTNEQNELALKQIQEKCAEREERLYEQISECQRINGEAIATITLYAERLGVIENDVKEIKTEVDKIATRV